MKCVVQKLKEGKNVVISHSSHKPRSMGEIAQMLENLGVTNVRVVDSLSKGVK
jgi:GTP cyclohydrolase II